MGKECSYFRGQVIGGAVIVCDDVEHIADQLRAVVQLDGLPDIAKRLMERCIDSCENVTENLAWLQEFASESADAAENPL